MDWASACSSSQGPVGASAPEIGTSDQSVGALLSAPFTNTKHNPGVYSARLPLGKAALVSAGSSLCLSLFFLSFSASFSPALKEPTLSVSALTPQMK